MKPKTRTTLLTLAIIVAVILSVIHFHYRNNPVELYRGFKGFAFFVGTFAVVITVSITTPPYKKKIKMIRTENKK